MEFVNLAVNNCLNAIGLFQSWTITGLLEL